MLKHRGAAFALAALIALGGFALYAEISSPKPPIKERTRVYDPCKETDEKSAERCTNQRIANYTWWLAVFTGLLVAVTGTQITFLVRADKTARISADAARESASIANRTLIAAQRPWISAEVSIESDLTFGKDGARITFGYVLRNVGNTPAINTEVFTKFIAREIKGVPGIPGSQAADTGAAISNELITFCKTSASFSESQAVDGFVRGDPIFPDQVLAGTITVTLPQKEIDVALETFWCPSRKRLWPVFIACVVYRFPSDTKSHYTGLMFDLFKLDRTELGPRTMIDPTEGTIAAAELILIPHVFRGGIAN